MQSWRGWTLLLTLFVAGCKPPQAFEVKGVVQEVTPGSKQVRIAHETIPGYMEAMTMSFDVRDPRELAGLQPGDSVAFRMLVTKDEGWIERVRKLGKATNAVPVMAAVSETFRRVREVDPLNVGDLVPPYHFTNELGQAVSLEGFRGQAMAITFLFTRCPFPTFCPRMTSNFEQAQKKLLAMSGGPTNWHLLTVTFDPQYDTPGVLKSYAANHGYDPRHWNYLTGDLIEITALTEQFGLMFWRPDPKEVTGISHNLRTAVLDTRGRVQRILKENEWQVDDLVAELVKAAQVPPEPATSVSR